MVLGFRVTVLYCYVTVLAVSFLCITVLAYRETVLGCCVTLLEVLGRMRRVELTLSFFAGDE